MLAGEIMNGPQAALHRQELLGVRVQRLSQGSQRRARLGHVDGSRLDQLHDLAAARIVTRHDFEIAAGIRECVRRRRDMLPVQPFERPPAAFEDRLRVREPALLGREPLGLIGTEPQSVELLELVSQEVEPGHAILAVP